MTMTRKEYLKELLEAAFGRTTVKMESYDNQIFYAKGWYDVNTFAIGYRDEKYLHLFREALCNPDVYVIKGGMNANKVFIRRDTVKNAVKYFRDRGTKCFIGVSIDWENEEQLDIIGTQLYEAFRIMLFDLFGKGCKPGDDVTSEYGLKLAEAIEYLNNHLRTYPVSDILIDGKHLIIYDTDCKTEYNYSYFQRIPIIGITPVYFKILPLRAWDEIKESPEESIPGLKRVEIHSDVIRLIPTHYSFARMKNQLEFDPQWTELVLITDKRIKWFSYGFYYLTHLSEVELTASDAATLENKLREASLKAFFQQYSKQISDYYFSVVEYIESILTLTIKLIDNGITETLQDVEYYKNILRMMNLNEQQLACVEEECSHDNRFGDIPSALLFRINEIIGAYSKQLTEKRFINEYCKYLGGHLIHQHYEAVSKKENLEKIRAAARQYHPLTYTGQEMVIENPEIPIGEICMKMDTEEMDIKFPNPNPKTRPVEKQEENVYETLLKNLECYIKWIGDIDPFTD